MKASAGFEQRLRHRRVADAERQMQRRPPLGVLVIDHGGGLCDNVPTRPTAAANRCLLPLPANHTLNP